MKNIWFGSIAVAAFVLAGSVRAADTNGAPVSKGPAPVAPSWTGFYVGAGVGLRASRADATLTSESDGGVQTNLVGRSVTEPLNGTGFRASPYIGFNWQFAPQWVVGIEGDLGLSGQTTALAGFNFGPETPSGLAGDSLALKTTWDAGLRGRIGILLIPTTMAYVTGGGSWQHYEVISTCVSPLTCTPTFTPAVIANPVTKMGWTVGAGFETVLWGHWLARTEYRYADFAAATFSIARTSTIPALNPTIENFDVTMRTHTVTFGLAYKFN